jgi:hypothetical protein
LVARVLEESSVLTDLRGVHAAYLTIAKWVGENPSSHAAKVAKWTASVAAATMFGHVVTDKLDTRMAAVKAKAIQDGYHTLIAPLYQVVDVIRVLKSARHASAAKKTAIAYAEHPDQRAALRQRAKRVARGLLPDRFLAAEFWAARVLLPTEMGLAVLPTGDMQRLEQYAVSVMNMAAVTIFDAALRLEDPTTDLAWMSAQFKRMSTATAEAPRSQSVHVCRAYMQAYKAALAAKAGREDAKTDAFAELAAMPLAKMSGALDHYAELASMTVGRIVNLGKVHKALPASTSLGAETVYGRFLKARQPNPVGNPRKGVPPLDMELVEKCLRDEVAIALRHMDSSLAVALKDPMKVPKWYTAWVDKKVVPAFPGWARDLDLRGSVRPLARSDYAAGTFKDSALAPDSVPLDAHDIASKTHTNMALRRFAGLDYPTQAAARASLASTHARTTKSDQKPENFKDPLRLFYEATLIDRMGVSWTEANVYNVAKHHPCYMLGKSPAEQQKKARSMSEPAFGGATKRFFSFDVSNWSAGMSAEIQRASGRLWAEVYDSVEVGSAYNTMARSTVYAQKHGVLAGYCSPTANFEGYDGKAMTMVHLALMSATVHRTRQVTGRADLAVTLMTYIDDGAAALELPVRVADSVFEEFMRCAEEVYAANRFVLHPLKCMPSDRMFIFLNEVYYAGAHEVSATKAALRIASEPKQEHDSLPDRVMTLSAGAQGAVQAGLPSTVAALLCYFLVAHELLTWSSKETKLLVASPAAVGLMIASPAAYYGLGVPSMRGFDKTGKGASLSEGISAMQSFALAYPGLARAVLGRLRTPLPPRSTLAILRNPTGTSGLSVLRTNRISVALMEVAPKLAVNPTAKQVMAPLTTFDGEAYAAAMFGDITTVSAAVIQMAWKACPLANAEAWLAKFRSSKTIASAIGRDKLASIMRSHRADAQLALKIALGLRAV